MTEARRKLLDRIKALLAKTVANGCTEAEALSALSVARRIMAEHEVTAGDLAAGGEDVERDSRAAEDRDGIREQLVGGVAAFCQCRGWKEGTLDQLAFCGLAGDVIFAHWLLDTLAEFVRRALTDHLAATWRPGMPSVRRTEIKAFVAGCCVRLAERLHQLAQQYAGAEGEAKHSLIKAKLRELGIQLKAERGSFEFLDAKAYDAGAARADDATFAKPINAGGPVPQLTGGRT